MSLPRPGDQLDGFRLERELGDTGYLFLINHGDAEARVAAAGHDLLDGSDHEGAVAGRPGPENRTVSRLAWPFGAP